MAQERPDEFLLVIEDDEEFDLRALRRAPNREEYNEIVADFFAMSCQMFHHVWPAQSRDDKLAGKMVTIIAVFRVEDYHAVTKLSTNKRGLLTALPSCGIGIYSAIPFFKMAIKLSANKCLSGMFGGTSLGYNSAINYYYTKEFLDDTFDPLVNPIPLDKVVAAFRHLEEFPEGKCGICLHYTGRGIERITIFGLAVGFSFTMFVIDLKQNNASIPSAAVFWFAMAMLNNSGINSLYDQIKNLSTRFLNWSTQRCRPQKWLRYQLNNDINALKSALIDIMKSAKSNIVGMIQRKEYDKIAIIFSVLDKIIASEDNADFVAGRMHHVLHLILLINSFADDERSYTKGTLAVKLAAVVLIGGVSMAGYYLSTVFDTKHFFDMFTNHPINWTEAWVAGSAFFIGFASVTTDATQRVAGRLWEAGVYAGKGVAQAWRESESVSSFIADGFRGMFRPKTLYRVVRLDLAAVQAPLFVIPVVGTAWALSPFTSATSLLLNRSTLQPFIGEAWHAFDPSTIAECMVFNSLPWEEIAIAAQRQWVALGSNEKHRKQLRLIKFIEKNVRKLELMTETRFLEYLWTFLDDNPHLPHLREGRTMNATSAQREEFIKHLFNHWSCETIFGNNHDYTESSVVEAITDMKRRSDELNTQGLFSQRRQHQSRGADAIPLMSVNQPSGSLAYMDDEDDRLDGSYQRGDRLNADLDF